MDYYKYGYITNCVTQLVATVLILVWVGSKIDPFIGNTGIAMFVGGIAGGVFGFKRLIGQMKALEDKKK